MPNNNAQLFLKNFGNRDLFQYADPEALKGYTVNDVNLMSEFVSLNGGQVKKSQVNKVPDDSPIPLNMSTIKNDDARLWNAIRNGDSLGGATFSRDNETTEYSNIELSSGTGLKGNSAQFIEVPLKFIK